jgi:hypothetical protein
LKQQMLASKRRQWLPDRQRFDGSWRALIIN